MYLKKTFIALILSALPIIGTMADGVRFLVVNAKDGSKTTFGLVDEPILSLFNGELNVVSSSRTFVISLADVQNYTFSEESTAIGETIKCENVKLENGFVVFNGLKFGDKVIVYTQDGKFLKESKSNTNGLAVLDLSGLPKGILILKSNTMSIKVINR